MLKLNNIYAGYQKGASVLNGINLSVQEYDTVAILGQNGCGKSSLAKAIVNLIPFQHGEIYFNNLCINSYNTTKRINSGMGYFMQGGRVFAHLSIIENLRIAAHQLSNKEFELRCKEMSLFFPIIQKGYIHTGASYLSGGEKHQLALAMVIMNKPKLLILDEPSAGLSPSNVDLMYNTLEQIKEREGVTVILIEQNADKAIKFCKRLALMQNGIIVKELNAENINARIQISEFYFNLET